MKHKLVVLATIIVAGLVIWPSIGAYNSYRQEHAAKIQAARAADEKTKSEQSANISSLKQKISQLSSDLDHTKEQCRLGLAAYNNLTTYAKSRMTMPDCK